MEKEPIKIKLSTVLLIIAVVVIVVIGVFIGFLYKQNIEKSNVESNSTMQENTNSLVEENATNVNFLEKNDSQTTTTTNAVTTENTSNTKSNSDYKSTDSKDFINNKILGKWKADKVVDANGNDIGLSAVWGTGIRYSNEMQFQENGILVYMIGITSSSDNGKYTINGNAVKIGIPTDIKGKLNWSNLTYNQKEDILKEEVDIAGEKHIVTYVRIKTNQNSKNNNSIKYTEITEKLNEDEIFYATNVEKNNGKYIMKGVIGNKYFSKNEYDDIIKRGRASVDGKIFNIEKAKVEQPNDDYEVLPYVIKNNEMGYDYGFFKKNSKYFVWAREMQFGEVWKKTNTYKQITLDKSIKCEDEYSEDQTSLDNEFKNFKNSSIESIGELIEHGSIYRFEFKNGKCVKLIYVTTGV